MDKTQVKHKVYYCYSSISLVFFISIEIRLIIFLSEEMSRPWSYGDWSSIPARCTRCSCVW